MITVGLRHRKSSFCGLPRQEFPFYCPSVWLPTLAACCTAALVSGIVILTQLRTCDRGGSLDNGHILDMWRCSPAVTEGGFWPSFISVVTIMRACSVVPDSCDPMDYSTQSSPVHGVFQARILQWVAISYSRGSSWPRDWSCVSCIAGQFFTTETPGKPKHEMSQLQIFLNFRRRLQIQ